jgi:hypothetical protein
MNFLDFDTKKRFHKNNSQYEDGGASMIWLQSASPFHIGSINQKQSKNLQSKMRNLRQPPNTKTILILSKAFLATPAGFAAARLERTSSLASVSAPASSSSRANSARPHQTAKISAVQLLCDCVPNVAADAGDTQEIESKQNIEHFGNKLKLHAPANTISSPRSIQNARAQSTKAADRIDVHCYEHLH